MEAFLLQVLVFLFFFYNKEPSYSTLTASPSVLLNQFDCVIIRIFSTNKGYSYRYVDRSSLDSFFLYDLNLTFLFALLIRLHAFTVMGKKIKFSISIFFPNLS